MNNAHITEMIAECGDYFVAHLDNGGVRIGLLGCECFTFAAYHDEYSRLVSLRGDDIETAYDEFYGRYCAK